MITRAVEDAIATASAALASARIESAEDVRRAGETLVRFSPAMAEAERGLKAFLFTQVYRSETVMVPVRESEAVVTRLFAAYMATADMPGRWGEQARAVSGAARARIVCDFIAGMTDPYALDEHLRLFDARPEFR